MSCPSLQGVTFRAYKARITREDGGTTSKQMAARNIQILGISFEDEGKWNKHHFPSGILENLRPKHSQVFKEEQEEGS